MNYTDEFLYIYDTSVEFLLNLRMYAHVPLKTHVSNSYFIAHTQLMDSYIYMCVGVYIRRSPAHTALA